MNTIELNGVEYAVGLSWTRLTGEKISAEMKAAALDRGMQYGLLCKNSEVTYIGLTNDEDMLGKFSAAGMLAAHAENILLIEEITDDRYWICCIVNGEVIPSGDMVVSSSSVADTLLDLTNLPMPDDVSPGIYASADVAELFDLEVVGNLTFVDIIEDNTPTKSMKVTKVKKGIGTIPLVFGLVVIGAACAVAYLTLNDDGAARRAELQRIMDGKNSSDSKLSVAEIKAAAAIEERKWFKEDFKRMDSLNAIQGVLDVFNDIKTVDRGGWTFEGLISNKEGSASKFVTASWKKTTGNTNSLKESLDAASYGFDLSGESASSSHMIFSKKEITVDVYDTYISGTKDSYLSLMDKLDNIPETMWTMALNTSKKSRPKLILDLPNASAAGMRVLPVLIRDLRVTGNNFETLIMLKDILANQEHKNVLLTQVKINYKSKLDWTVMGEIYEN